MGWEPRLPLVLAEQHVHWPKVNQHIIDQRHHLEQAAKPVTRRLAVIADQLHGVTPARQLAQLEQTLRTGLDRTARFGFREAQREIRSLRRGGQPPVRASYAIPEAADSAGLARLGEPGIALLVARRARASSQAVAKAVNDAAQKTGLSEAERLAALTMAAERALRNVVLDMVGEVLNVSRAAGALALPDPPEFAMRSEQLDENTCDECDAEHGGIYQVDSHDFYEHLPPAFCLGGGRCRGVMVFGDGPVDFRQEEDLAA